MCCGNCSVGENVLAKFEGYPAIIGIINMKLTSRLYILSTIDWKEIEGLKDARSVSLYPYNQSQISLYFKHTK